MPNQDAKPPSQPGILAVLGGNHSPASPERQQGRRDPWDPEHPAGEKRGVKTSGNGIWDWRCGNAGFGMWDFVFATA